MTAGTDCEHTALEITRKSEGRYRSAMLAVMFPEHRDACRRTTLAFCLNGDWEDPVPTHYCSGGHGPGCNAKLLAEHVAGAMVCRLLKIFPRHRWTGAEETLRDCCVLFGPHRCLEVCGPIWLQCLKGNRDPTPRDFEAQGGCMCGSIVCASLLPETTPRYMNMQLRRTFRCCISYVQLCCVSSRASADVVMSVLSKGGHRHCAR
jgi:hypothetical protein